MFSIKNASLHKTLHLGFTVTQHYPLLVGDENCYAVKVVQEIRSCYVTALFSRDHAMFTSAVKKGEIEFYKVTLSGVLRFDTVTQMSPSLIVSLLMDQNALHLYKVARLISFLIITNPI